MSSRGAAIDHRRRLQLERADFAAVEDAKRYRPTYRATQRSSVTRPDQRDCGTRLLASHCNRRPATAGRAIFPSVTSRSSVLVVSSALRRATGIPRSVISTSWPSRTRDKYSLRCARTSVTATSIFQFYRRATSHPTLGRPDFETPVPNSLHRGTQLERILSQDKPEHQSWATNHEQLGTWPHPETDRTKMCGGDDRLR